MKSAIYLFETSIRFIFYFMSLNSESVIKYSQPAMMNNAISKILAVN